MRSNGWLTPTVKSVGIISWNSLRDKRGKEVKKIEHIEVLNSWKYLGVELLINRDIYKVRYGQSIEF